MWAGARARDLDDKRGMMVSKGGKGGPQTSVSAARAPPSRRGIPAARVSMQHRASASSVRQAIANKSGQSQSPSNVQILCLLQARAREGIRRNQASEAVNSWPAVANPPSGPWSRAPAGMRSPDLAGHQHDPARGEAGWSGANLPQQCRHSFASHPKTSSWASGK